MAGMPAFAPPAAAALAAFVLTVVPVVLLMTVWACVTVARLLFPERPLPLDGPSRRERALRRGESRPVGLREIMDDETRRRHAARTRPAATVDAPPRPPFADDLWLRRN